MQVSVVEHGSMVDLGVTVVVKRRKKMVAMRGILGVLGIRVFLKVAE